MMQADAPSRNATFGFRNTRNGAGTKKLWGFYGTAHPQPTYQPRAARELTRHLSLIPDHHISYHFGFAVPKHNFAAKNHRKRPGNSLNPLIFAPPQHSACNAQAQTEKVPTATTKREPGPNQFACTHSRGTKTRIMSSESLKTDKN